MMLRRSISGRLLALALLPATACLAQAASTDDLPPDVKAAASVGA